MRYPRIRLRTLLILVAMAAMVFAGMRLVRRRAEFLVEAERCEAQARLYLAIGARAQRLSARLPDEQVAVETSLRQSKKYQRLAQKYRHAASRPWISLPPDPPGP
jgi:tRNA C32,U32 (ribose-2'-O)-methylase TrmJ